MRHKKLWPWLITIDRVTDSLQLTVSKPPYSIKNTLAPPATNMEEGDRWTSIKAFTCVTPSRRFSVNPEPSPSILEQCHGNATQAPDQCELTRKLSVGGCVDTMAMSVTNHCVETQRVQHRLASGCSPALILCGISSFMQVRGTAAITSNRPYSVSPKGALVHMRLVIDLRQAAKGPLPALMTP